MVQAAGGFCKRPPILFVLTVSGDGPPLNQYSYFCDLGFTKLFGFDDVMYASTATASTATGGTSAIGAAPPAGPDRNKLESRFLWLLTSAGVKDSTMDAFGKMGMHSLTLFRHLAKDDDRRRKLLKKAPIDLDEDADTDQALEVANARRLSSQRRLRNRQMRFC